MSQRRKHKSRKTDSGGKVPTVQKKRRLFPCAQATMESALGTNTADASIVLTSSRRQKPEEASIATPVANGGARPRQQQQGPSRRRKKVCVLKLDNIVVEV